MNLDEVLDEFERDVLDVLRQRIKQADKVTALRGLLVDLLDPAAVAAVAVPSARVAIEQVEYGNALVQLDANGDVVRVEFSAPVEIELHERL